MKQKPVNAIRRPVFLYLTWDFYDKISLRDTAAWQEFTFSDER